MSGAPILALQDDTRLRALGVVLGRASAMELFGPQLGVIFIFGTSITLLGVMRRDWMLLGRLQRADPFQTPNVSIWSVWVSPRTGR
jgi:hypothetical protein